MIVEPVTLSPDALVGDALDLMARYRVSGIPIVDDDERLVGILTNRDLRFGVASTTRVADAMTREGLVTAPVGTTLEEAQAILGRHRIEKLPIVDLEGRLKGLITVKDISKREAYPLATKDERGRLRVAAAVGSGHRRARARRRARGGGGRCARGRHGARPLARRARRRPAGEGPPTTCR